MYLNDSVRVFHVSKAGNDNNGGKAQQYPVSLANDSKLTIMAAVNAAADGDTIIIWPGTYTEQLPLTQEPAKTLTFVGMNRAKTIITQSGTNDTITGTCGIPYGKFFNLSITQTGTGRAVVVTVGLSSVIDFVNCDITSSGACAVSANGSERVSLKNCYLSAKADTILTSDMLVLDGCIVISDAGLAGISDASCIYKYSTLYSGGPGKLFIKDSTLLCMPAYRKTGPKSPPLYEVTADIKCIRGPAESIICIIDNSNLIADGYKPSQTNANSYCSGDAFCVELIDKLIAKNSVFFSRTDQNQSAADSYGLKNCNAQINNCTFAVSGTDSSYCFDADSARTVYLENTKYNPSQIGANVTVNAVPAGATFEKAAKLLVNKAVQNKITGVIDYYDDDGQTVLFTHAPVDDESTITRTPS